MKKNLQLATSSEITICDFKGIYIQHFQVLQVFECPNDSQIKWFCIKEFQYSVKGDSPMVSFIGQKLVFLNQNSNYDVEFVPLYESDKALIIGTCLIFKHKLEKNKSYKKLPLYNFKQ